jgi:hypothetical protein
VARRRAARRRPRRAPSASSTEAESIMTRSRSDLGGSDGDGVVSPLCFRCVWCAAAVRIASRDCLCVVAVFLPLCSLLLLWEV